MTARKSSAAARAAVKMAPPLELPESAPTPEARSSRAFDAPLQAWFATQGWKPAPFQRAVWKHWTQGQSGLLVTPTGSGKTWAAVGGALLQGLAELKQLALPARKRGASALAQKKEQGQDQATERGRASKQPVLRLLWVTPLRALATDTQRALTQAVQAVGLPWAVALRTGDASARDKRLARQGGAEIVVITPESLALLLSYADSADIFAGLQGVVVDEWHELLANKRGVLLQLTLARVLQCAPDARLWGLSATLGNVQEARDVLLAPVAARAQIAPVVQSARPRRLQLHTLLPQAGERFPWAGHLGLSQLGRVAQLVSQARSAIVFTNTRAQAELWHRALASIWLQDPASLALHHGSLDVQLRRQAQEGLRSGAVRCVVATSSLELGVDFPEVECVLQIGSPKGVARLLQRAGRSRHRPGAVGEVWCVPTHALELADYAALRLAVQHGEVEPRVPLRLALDVLAQHCVTLALGGGFDADALYAQVRSTHAFSKLTAVQWQAVLDFIVQGGAALEKYPEFHRVERLPDGAYRVLSKTVGLRHRLSIGTITDEGSMQVRYLKGGGLGALDERFVARLSPGDRFHFAGRTLELVAVDGMVAYVRKSARADGVVPRWQGSRMPMSSALGLRIEEVLHQPPPGPEMRVLAPLLQWQAELSALPAPGSLLAELVTGKKDWQLFIYPLAGRAVHEGMAAIVALRWGRLLPNTFTYAVNDYGLCLKAQVQPPLDEALLSELLMPHGLLDDLKSSLNMTEMMRRQFRDIARIAGMLPPRSPGRAAPSMRQLQTSSGLLFDVLQRYDPGHVLLGQAAREVLENQMDFARLHAAFLRCASRQIVLTRPAQLTPLSFPLWAENQRGELSTEAWSARIQRASEQLNARAAR